MHYFLHVNAPRTLKACRSMVHGGCINRDRKIADSSLPMNGHFNINLMKKRCSIFLNK